MSPLVLQTCPFVERSKREDEGYNVEILTISSLFEDEGKDELWAGRALGTECVLPAELGLETKAVVMLWWLLDPSFEPMLGSLPEAMLIFLMFPAKFGCEIWWMFWMLLALLLLRPLPSRLKLVLENPWTSRTLTALDQDSLLEAEDGRIRMSLNSWCSMLNREGKFLFWNKTK